jgi:hypothetical protein
LLSFLVSAGCRVGEEGALVDSQGGSEFGTVVLALTNVPTDVRCVRVTVTGGQTVVRLFDVMPGQASNLALPGLPVGPVTVYEDAFNVACSDVTEATPATWVSEAPASVTLVPGQQASLTVTLRRASGLSITSDFADGTGALRFMPASLDFGGVPGGQTSAAMQVHVTNAGGTQLTPIVSITGMRPGDFSISSSSCMSLPPAQSCDVMVRFTPSGAGARDAVLTFTTPGASAGVPMTGRGLAPVSLSPSSQAFGAVSPGAESPAFAFTITNHGGPFSPSVAIGGANAADFVVESNACGSPLPTLGSCQVHVRFRPTAGAPGVRSASLLARMDGPSAALTGTVPETLSIAPFMHDFGTVRVGTTSGAASFVVTNGTSTELQPTVSLGGMHASEFAITSPSCPALMPGGRCSVSVTFTPAAGGARSASLQVTSSAGGRSAPITGAGAATGVVSVSPASHDFGQTDAGRPTGPTTFTVSNGTAWPFTPVIGLTGPDAATFEVTLNTCTTLPAGGECSVHVRFAPPAAAAAGARSATLSTGAMGASATVTGRVGLGGAVSFDQGMVSFGGITLGQESAPIRLTLINGTNTPFSPLLGLVGAAPADFAIVATSCGGMSLPANGGACSVDVRFRPTAATPRGATLTSGFAGAQVALSGTGLPGGSVPFSPSSLSFGVVPVASSSGIVNLTMTNATSNPFSPMLSVAGPDAAEFEIAGGSCIGATLDPMGSCTVGVRFRPVQAGVKSAVLLSGFAGSTATLAGTGGGWASQDVGAVGVMGSSTQGPTGLCTVRGSGADIWGGADELHYMSHRIGGDATITARVTGLQNTNAWAKAGVMMRDGTGTSARNAFAFVTPDPGHGYRFQTRVTTGTSTAAGGTGTVPAWLRLVRRGNTFTGYYSSNGMAWTQMGAATNIMMASTINVGLAVTSHADGTINTATFDNVIITQP